MLSKKERDEWVKALAYSIILAAFSDAALAGPLDTLGTKVLNFLNNTFLKTVATIMIILLFLSGFAKKLSWTTVLIYAGCISGMFSAAAIVTYFQGVKIG